LAGIEIDKLGGWLTLEIDAEGQEAVRIRCYTLRR